ncbi:hypothetical protein HanPI659440_Chr11g0441901 [Helianthus annuus]|nr:hypothetical protein HanPI659440_Chr11g0441901 [Helianthus annuus]
MYILSLFRSSKLFYLEDQVCKCPFSFDSWRHPPSSLPPPPIQVTHTHTHTLITTDGSAPRFSPATVMPNVPSCPLATEFVNRCFELLTVRSGVAVGEMILRWVWWCGGGFGGCGGAAVGLVDVVVWRQWLMSMASMS